MLFIGICGASGSGKTTLSAELVKALSNARCLVINQDAYYLDHPDLTLEERGRLNYDEPSIFDHDLLLEDYLELQAGRPIKKRAYDFTQHRRNDSDELLEPPDVLIVEGIHAFYDQRLLDHIKPDVVHIMADGRIIRTGGPELALEVEQNGYADILAEAQ